jgi:hypothetical protein
MLIEMILIRRVIVFLDRLEGLRKPNNCTSRIIEVDAGDARCHASLVFLADQSVDSGLTLCVTGNVFPWTKILQIGMDLAAHG